MELKSRIKITLSLTRRKRYRGKLGIGWLGLKRHLPFLAFTRAYEAFVSYWNEKVADYAESVAATP